MKAKEKQERLPVLLHQEQMLFQRLNFFLIATAFLITALASVVSSNRFCPNAEHDVYLVYLAHAIIIVGFLLACFFSVTNYLNARLVQQTWYLLRPQANGTENTDVG